MASILTIGARPAAQAQPGGRFGLGGGTGAMLQYLTRMFNPSLHQPGLAPMAPGQIKQRAAGYVNSAITPQIAALESNSARATAGGVGQIRGGTENYAGAMAPYADRASQIGKDAAAQDTLETGALSSYLKGSGADTFGDVASKLQAAGISAPAAPNMGEGSGAITAATGIASARAAGQTGANNAELANLLPGFARLAGQQAENTFRSGQQGSLADAESTLRGQIPGMTSQVVGDLTQNETAKANARAGYAGDRASALATFLGNSVDDKTQLDLANLSGLFDTQVASAKASAPSSSLSKAYGHPVDATGNTISDTPLPGFTYNSKTGKYEKAPSASDGRVRQGEQRQAVSNADTRVRSIVTGALKTASKRSSASAGPFGGGKTSKPEIGSPEYNQAVNAAVTSAEALLGDYMSHEEIVQFVQQRALHAGWAQPKQAAPDRLGPLAPGQTAPLR